MAAARASHQARAIGAPPKRPVVALSRTVFRLGRLFHRLSFHIAHVRRLVQSTPATLMPMPRVCLLILLPTCFAPADKNAVGAVFQAWRPGHW
eukprot:COSAG05_NODE_3319_length_2151_cov_1.550682_2_plen_93_part_00